MELSQDTIVRAWRDEEFFDSLTADEQAAVPESPVGRASLGAGASYLDEAAETYQGQCGTFISSTCDTFISGCCSTFISDTCDTFISGCCGIG
jgi:mersacidin/lichenicidin family type 2 lantibiotic